MNPFFIEGIQISLDTWRWLYYRQYQDIKVPLNKVGLAHLNTLVRHGLLVYQKGRFHLTDLSIEVLSKVKQYEKDLKEGLPLSSRSTVVDLRRYSGERWLKGKTSEKKTFITNKELTLFCREIRYLNPFVSEDTLDIEVVISLIRKAIFSEGYLDVYPRVLCRPSFFEPGVIWFRGTVGDSIAIDEGYYDLIMALSGRTYLDPSFIKVSLDEDYIIARNPFLQYRYLDDVIAICRAANTEEFLYV